MSLRRSVVWLGESLGADAGLVGPKAAQLSRLAAAHPVPAGFCLTAEAYRIAAREGGLTDELAQHVSEAYARLVRGDSGQAVAVRSSAIDEDGPFASFAGQHDTHLNVIGLDAVIAAIDGTWRSLHSDAAMAYRRRHGLGLDGLALAVLVQRMVPADVAGVAFSIDPVAGRQDRVVVSASWGLGESIVGGTVTPDVWTVDKASLDVVAAHHADKRRMTVAADGGTREVDVPGFLRLRPSLTEAQAREVASVARDLERTHGWPVDIEFAFSGDRFHLLQCRPVTALGAASATSKASSTGAAGPTATVEGREAEADSYHGLPEPEWVEPEDAARHWRRDVAHFPTPITTLDGDYGQIVERGFVHGVARYRAPFWYKLRRFWGHLYFAEGKLDAPPALPDGATALDVGTQANDLERTWVDRWLPALQSYLDRWAAFDLESAPDDELLTHLDDTIEGAHRVWELHFEVVFPVGRAKRQFTELYGELFQPTSPLEPLALLRGFDNLTTRAGHAAWRLRDAVSGSPELVETLLDATPAEALRILQESPSALPTRRALDDFLARYGNRTHHLGLSAPTLVEDPTPVVKQLQDALRRTEYDPEQHRLEAASERDRAVAAARDALRGYPETVREEFETRLEAAQAAVRLNEDHNYLIDYSSSAAIRRVFLEAGKRLAASGLLETADDVLHLTMKEVRDALAGGPQASDGLARAGLRNRVEERKAAYERFAGATVPYEFGVQAPPPAEASAAEETPGDADDASSDATAPGTTAPDATASGTSASGTTASGTTASGTTASGTAVAPLRTLTGTPGSSGMVRGRVRVLFTFDDATTLRPGEVLVAPTTAQPWTPLFATAAALVTDSGGMLSHTAVVAREYGLPAVVGVGNATAMLRDGMLVEVDGDRGTVRVLDRKA